MSQTVVIEGIKNGAFESENESKVINNNFSHFLPLIRESSLTVE